MAPRRKDGVKASHDDLLGGLDLVLAWVEEHWLVAQHDDVELFCLLMEPCVCGCPPQEGLAAFCRLCDARSPSAGLLVEDADVLRCILGGTRQRLAGGLVGTTWRLSGFQGCKLTSALFRPREH